MAATDSQRTFPAQYASTHRFTSGAPRGFSVDPTGRRVLFLRSPSGQYPVAALWTFDVATGGEGMLADPRSLLDQGEELPAAERARRERVRERTAGIVAFATDDAHNVAAFALSGRLFVVDTATGDVSELPTAGPVVDPRPDPTGARVGYVTDGALHVVTRAGVDHLIAADPAPDVSWGLAEFIAAEEIDRVRGFWWLPGGERLLAARVDESMVAKWYVSDPARPDSEPKVIRYPRTGTANADVSLHLVDLAGGSTEVSWDRSALPYVVDVSTGGGHPLVVVETRDQRTLQVRAIDMVTGRTDVVHEQTDDAWIELVPGAPGQLGDGRLVTTVDADDTRRLCVDGTVVTPVGVQVMAVDIGRDDVLILGTDDPTHRHAWHLDASGSLRRVTQEPGVHGVARGGGLFVIASASMDHHGRRITLYRDGRIVGEIASYAEQPVLTPSVTFLTTGQRELRSAVLLPSGHERGTPLPVLLYPYGGPHPWSGQVIRSRAAHLTSQWFADQGFAVVVTDGRGTPGRGPAWERAIRDDWAGAVLEDQVDALHAVAATVPDMDLTRVGIRGWSFGGYLAALAVLRRPDVFHAAVAGAPATDWTLYDTFYTERYLGLPDEHPDRYAAASLLGDAAKLERALLLVHGLSDDNVVAAHTLRLSSALLAAGRPHSVLPLPGVTHMTSQQTVEESLLLLEVAFFREELSRAASRG